MACHLVPTTGCWRRWHARTGASTATSPQTGDCAAHLFTQTHHTPISDCATPLLTQRILRHSCCSDADADAFYKHHYYATEEETVAGVLQAGTDVDCTSFVGKFAQSAFDKKLIDEELIDKRLANLFKVRMRLGHFDPAGAASDLLLLWR